jgi:hypothetical protein
LRKENFLANIEHLLQLISKSPRKTTRERYLLMKAETKPEGLQKLIIYSLERIPFSLCRFVLKAKKRSVNKYVCLLKV